MKGFLAWPGREVLAMNSSGTHPHPCTQQAPTMPFGKYRGTPLEDLPAEYLLWVGCLSDLRQPLLGHVLKEMGRRIMELDQKTATADKGAP